MGHPAFRMRGVTKSVTFALATILFLLVALVPAGLAPSRAYADEDSAPVVTDEAESNEEENTEEEEEELKNEDEDEAEGEADDASEGDGDESGEENDEENTEGEIEEENEEEGEENKVEEGEEGDEHAPEEGAEEEEGTLDEEEEENGSTELNLRSFAAFSALSIETEEGGETGTLVIVKYTCPEDAEIERDEHGPDEDGDHDAPDECERTENVHFGYVHETDEPYEGFGSGEPIVDAGATDEDGELVIEGLSSEGRYSVGELDDEGELYPDSHILGLFCVGDDGENSPDGDGDGDNIDYTFVPAGGTVYCVSYNIPLAAEGSLHITKYSCPAETEVTRSGNGPDEDGDHEAPEQCSLTEGVKFGYNFEEDRSSSRGFGPGSPEIIEAGETDENGELLIPSLPSTDGTDGQYNVGELDEQGELYPDSRILGLFCTGDDGAPSPDGDGDGDNVDFTFIPAGGTAYCVSYNIFEEDNGEEPEEPSANATSTLTVYKQVINDEGGTSTPSLFTIIVSGSAVSTTEPVTDLGGNPVSYTLATSSATTTISFAGSSEGVRLSLWEGGLFSIEETVGTSTDGNFVYVLSKSGTCEGTVGSDDLTCTFTNDDSPVGTGGEGGGNGDDDKSSGPVIVGIGSSGGSSGGGGPTLTLDFGGTPDIVLLPPPPGPSGAPSGVGGDFPEGEIDGGVMATGTPVVYEGQVAGVTASFWDKLLNWLPDSWECAFTFLWVLILLYLLMILIDELFTWRKDNELLLPGVSDRTLSRRLAIYVVGLLVAILVAWLLAYLCIIVPLLIIFLLMTGWLLWSYFRNGQASS